MKAFKTFLTESKNLGELYHVCDYKSLKHIIESNILESKNYNYVSLTRDKNLWPKIEFIISIDGGKLSNNYPIKPFAMQGEDGGGNILYYKEEKEEAVLAKQIKNISKYINFIALRENNFNLLKYGYDADFEWVFDDNKKNVIKFLSKLNNQFGLKIQKGSSFVKDDKWFSEHYINL